jgi:hypothetical protein
MVTERPDPTKLFTGALPQVRIAQGQPTAADEAATRYLYEAYTDKDGFHCPKCGKTITNPNEAIDHIKDEINETMANIHRIIASTQKRS